MSEANRISASEASRVSPREASESSMGESSDPGREPMFLASLDQSAPAGSYEATILAMQSAGLAVPQIMFLFAYKPERTEHLSRFTHEVMRGPSPLAPGMRELIAAYTSRLNQCPF